ncbi:MAG: DUF302 domain-containing protein [Euryhalocaulis sp.]|uniref:DUF302 domain-containing protein n=1 Tax=Euryhalocaulis sp. TaxID=2744307 RepID=UPI0018096CDC|nr:DUF302 domain-containing protein [Euryhalocaulis sp.]MBA4801061.1 DUF302 domain-containing protein [Euryhalocaulis sp.]
MTYYFSKIIQESDFNAAVQRTTNALEGEGFGVLADIDVAQTLKKKLDVDFRPYRILGACNPALAHQALQMEDKIGVMLPCNVIVQRKNDEEIEIAAVDPVASMSSVDNADLTEIAQNVRTKLSAVINAL